MRPKLTTERTAGTEKLEKPLCALCAPWYDPPVQGVPTERTAGTEKLEKPLCAPCAPWYDPPVQGILFPQRARRMVATSVCSVVGYGKYIQTKEIYAVA